MKPLRTVARGMLAGTFVSGGAKALADPDPLVPRAQPVVDRVAPVLARVDKRMPTDARSLVQLNGAVQLVGGLMLLTGLRRPAAAVLAASLVPTTFAGHRFWAHREPEQQAQQQTQFLKNLGLMGGLILAALDTEGRPNLRYRVARTMKESRQKVRLAARAADLGRRLPG
jgi:putative oxidoreductase